MATLSKPLAVVTGASTGIGYELARQLAERGHDLVICAENAELDAAATRIRELGVRVEAVRADLSTEAGCRQLQEAVAAFGKPLEVIALNAGVGAAGDFVSETDLDEEIHSIELNVIGTTRLAKWAARDMAARGRGRILITASLAAIMPTPLQTIYGATKAFDLSLAAGLHAELADKGVTVTAMLPGPTDTEFFRKAGMLDTKAAEKAHDNQPADVAKQGLEALFAGHERVAAGNFSVKLQGAMSRFMSEGTKASMYKDMATHGSAGK